MLYIAYGSNINPIQMWQLCTHVPTFIGIGELHGFEMDFYATANSPNASVYADVVRKSGKTTPVVVWDIVSEDSKVLDAFESYPTLYKKIDNCKVILNGTNQEVRGVLYQMHSKRGKISTPNVKYLSTIYQGYLFSNLNMKYLMDRKGLNLKGSKI